MAFDNLFDQIGGWGDKLGDMVSGVSTFDIGVVKWGSLSQWQFFATFIIYIAIGLFVFLIIYKFFVEYKIKVDLIYKTGGNIIELKTDIAKEIIDVQGKRKLQLFWKKKLSAPVPSLNYKYKKGKRDCYEFVVDDNNNLHPCEKAAGKSMYDSEGKITEVYKTNIVPQERTAWSMMERKLIEERIRKKGWFDKHKEFILTAGMFAAMVLVSYFMFDYLKRGSFAIAQQLGQIATNCMRGGG